MVRSPHHPAVASTKEVALTGVSERTVSQDVCVVHLSWSSVAADDKGDPNGHRRRADHGTGDHLSGC
ncbi:MAG: hypothetical protein EOO38_27575 [Cytophagaceae bacterium]|nr:MAG: hypothetical protein EOO38_27575 [Cytophagaceae bacterium]